jgi:3',5'-cyclic AMP phosphodiesterase CpdA
VGRRLLVLVLLVLACTAGSGSAATRFLALGDFGVGGTTEQAMGDSLRRYEATHPADLLVTLGDNDYTESPSAFHSNWVGAFGWVQTAGVLPTGSLGNHDVRVDGGRYEFDELAMPRSRYRRVRGPVEIFVLNSNSVGANQTDWLRRRLAASTAIWKIAVFHHPAYTCGGYLGNAAVQRRWVPLFERYDVDLVLSGHDHNYQHFRPRNGVRYVVHGGGGARLYPLRSCPAGYPKRRFARAAHGFLAVNARTDRLVIRAIRRDGTTLDRVVIYP